jgi:hypothetical protein
VSDIPDIRCPVCGGEIEVDVDWFGQEVAIDCSNDQCATSWDRWGQNPKREPPINDAVRPYRLELWRVDPEQLVSMFVLPPGGQLCWSPDPERPWTRPAGWPVGYEWRLWNQADEVQRSPVWVEPGGMVAAYRAP